MLFNIKIYWLVKPKRFSGRCLFKESCSHYVYKNTKKGRFLKGLQSLSFRIKNCRPGYHVVEIKGKRGIITRNKLFFEMRELCDQLI